MHEVFLRALPIEEKRGPKWIPPKFLKISEGLTIPQAIKLAQTLIYPHVPTETYESAGLVGVGIISAVNSEITRTHSADETVLSHPLVPRFEVAIKPAIRTEGAL